MYVRWKRQRWTRTTQPQGRDPVPPDREALYAVLVCSERRDGKPRQRVVKHLAGYDPQRVNVYRKRFTFWRKVTAKLDELDLPEQQRQAIEAALQQRIKRPTEEETKEMEESRAAFRRLFKGR